MHIIIIRFVSCDIRKQTLVWPPLTKC